MQYKKQNEMIVFTEEEALFFDDSLIGEVEIHAGGYDCQCDCDCACNCDCNDCGQCEGD